MFSQLKQLHPLPSRKNVLVVAIFMGLAVALFLIVFQPFGLTQVPAGTKKTYILAGYGLVTMAVVSINGILMPALFPRLYIAERWTLGKDLFLLGLLNFAGVALLNFFYSAWTFGFTLSLQSVAFSLFATLSVGFLPFALLVMYRHNRLLQQNLVSAAAINAQIPAHIETVQPEAKNTLPEKLVTVYAEGGKDRLTFKAANLLYAESADNYIKVTVAENGTAKTTMLRQTLKNLEDLLKGEPNLIRCHRSFVVNLNKVVQADGNAQGLQLKLDGSDDTVPVSRSYVPVVKALLNSQ